MGMSASQARLLSITARLGKNELHSQLLANSKARLANKTQAASDEYLKALEATKLVYSNYDGEGNPIQTVLTPALMYTYGDIKNQYGISNTSGQLLVSATDAVNFENAANLEDFLKAYGIKPTQTDNPQYTQALINLFGDDYAKYYDVATGSVINFAPTAKTNDSTFNAQDLYDNYSDYIMYNEYNRVDTYINPIRTALIPNPPSNSNIQYQFDISTLQPGIFTNTIRTNYSDTCNALADLQNNINAQVTGIITNNPQVTQPTYDIDVWKLSYDVDETVCQGYLNDTTRQLGGYAKMLIEAMISDPDDAQFNITAVTRGTFPPPVPRGSSISDQSDYVNECVDIEDQYDLDIANMANDLDSQIPTVEQQNLVNAKAWQDNVDNLYTLYNQLISSLPNKYITSYDDPKSQWYINLWHRMNGESDTKSTDGRSGKYFKQLEDNLLNSSEWIKFALQQGVVVLEKVNFTDSPETITGLKNTVWKQIIHTNCADISEVDDEVALARADAKYTQAINEIEAEEKKLTNQMELLDTEHNELQTEYDSLKTILGKNVSRSFGALKA